MSSQLTPRVARGSRLRPGGINPTLPARGYPCAGLLLGLVLGACGDPGPKAIGGTQVAFDVREGAGFYDAPFPVAHRVRADGTLVVADFPGASASPLLGSLLEALERSPVGFGTTAGVWFRFTGPLDPSTLPDVAGSLEAESGVFLVDVDPSSPGRDQRVPVEVHWKAAAETYSPANLLVLLPRPGFVLRPGTLYAAVVTTGVRDAEGRALGSPLALERLKAGRAPEGPHGDLLKETFAPLWAHLERAGLPRGQVRAATVYRTGDPYAEMDRLRAWVLSRPAPLAEDATWLEDYPTYCVVEGRVTVPLVQDGERPYTSTGGEIRLDADGAPVAQAEETIRFALSIPKRPMPATGWPLLFYSAGQGGAYTQFVHRGTAEEQQSVPGRGPALYLADVGLCALSIEAPLVGPRHPQGSVEGLEFFNVTNPVAFRDNVRQAALDFVTLARLAEDLVLDPGLCPEADAGAGGGAFFFDTSRFTFYGHSTGATIGSLVLGLEPSVRAGLLSGVGGSWLYNLVDKFEPLRFADLVRLLLNLDGSDDPDLADPALHLFQIFAEPSEPMNWARRWAREPGPGAGPRDILVLEGVVDGYFPPPSVNALALAAGLEPVAPTVEETLLETLALVGGTLRPTPATGNLTTSSGTVSALIAQYLPPAGVSGHYVAFELSEPKYQYKCFFESLIRTGEAVVPTASASALAPCP